MVALFYHLFLVVINLDSLNIFIEVDSLLDMFLFEHFSQTIIKLIS